MATEKFKWKRPKRGKNYVPPLLSNRDEDVPPTHFGIFYLLRNKKDPVLFMSEYQCQKLRKDAFDTVYELYKKYGTPDFANFWNYNIDTFIDVGLNKFCSNARLAPVAGIIECFEKKTKLVTNDKWRYVISFGISKKRLSDFVQSAIRAKKAGIKIAPPRIIQKYPKSRDFIFFGDIGLNTGKNVERIDRNAVYNQFCDWCRVSGTTHKNAITTALKEFVENHPLDEVGELQDYDVITDLDKIVFAKRRDKAIKEAVRLDIDADVFDLAKQIIWLYNRDVDNLGKPTLDLHTYVTNALHLLNRNMDLKYRDPELYERKKQIEKMEEQADE